MDFLFAWYNLIFLLPILTGIVATLAATSGFGMEVGESDGTETETEGHASGGFDADSDSDSDADGDNVSDHAIEAHSDGNLFERALSLLGVGRVPLSILITISSLTFGGMGILLNFFFMPIFKIPMVTLSVSLSGSLIAMLVVTNSLARGLSKILPSVESYGISHSGLEGRVGTLVLAANTEFGVLHVVDEYHQLHRVQCKTTKGTLPEGTEVIIINYEKSENVYYVEAMSAWRVDSSSHKNDIQPSLAQKDRVDEKEEQDTKTNQRNNYEGTKS